MSDRLHVSFQVGAVTTSFKDKDVKAPTSGNSFLPNWGLGCRADWGLRTTMTLAGRRLLLGPPSNAVRRDFPWGIRSVSSWPRPRQEEVTIFQRKRKQEDPTWSLLQKPVSFAFTVMHSKVSLKSSLPSCEQNRHEQPGGMSGGIRQLQTDAPTSQPWLVCGHQSAWCRDTGCPRWPSSPCFLSDKRSDSGVE